MVSVNGAEVAVKLSESPPPQLRIVGFTATTTIGSASDSPSDTCGTSPRAVPESPLSQLLRSATWPTLRVRLCKSEIPAGSPSVQDVNAADAVSKSPSDTTHARSTSPISIPRVCRYWLVCPVSSVYAQGVERLRLHSMSSTVAV